MKIGFLLCAYNQEEFIFDCLQSLIEFSNNKHIISAVSLPFKEYRNIEIEVDNTTNILKEELSKNNIQYLITGPRFISEADARNLALKPLLKEECDFIILVDSDEIWTINQLKSLEEYISKAEFITWFSICYKNYVGNGYLEEPFTPPRAFRTKIPNATLSHFYFDNDIMYITNKKNIITYKSLSNKTIPQNLIWCNHYSWTNTQKNKNKIIYQSLHFPSSGCSYKWDEGEGIIFNEEYYKQTNQIKPKIIY